MKQLALIVHNLRSTHNVGSLLRTADGLGVQQVWLTGYTPYPLRKGDKRLPHLAEKLDKQIHKTALGAEKSVKWQQAESIYEVIRQLRHAGFKIAALEQTEAAQKLTSFKPPEKLGLVVGNETDGLESEIIAQCDLVLEIPMLGDKESFNVVQAAAMALYHMRYKMI